MASQDYIKLGSWNFYCQICGDKVKMPGGASKDFRGLWVCPDCLDIQNPQEKPTYRPPRPKTIFPTNTSVISASELYLGIGHDREPSGGIDVIDPIIAYGKIGHDDDSSNAPKGTADHDTT